MHADADDSGTSDPGPAAAGGRISWLRIFLLSGPECDRHPFAYGVALTVWLLVVSLVAGLALLPVKGTFEFITEDSLKPESLNLARLPTAAIFLLKVLHLPAFYVKFGEVATILGAIFLILAVARHRLGWWKSPLLLVIILLELAVLVILSYRPLFEWTLSTYLLDARTASAKYLEIWRHDLAVTRTVVGWIIICGCSFIFTPRLNPWRRVLSTLALAVIFFLGAGFVAARFLYTYRIDSVLGALVTGVLCVTAPAVFIYLTTVVAIPEVLRTSQGVRSTAYGILPAMVVGAILVLTPNTLKAVQNRTHDPTLAKIVSKFDQMGRSRGTNATDIRATLLLEPDGYVSFDQDTVDAELEHLIESANGLPSADLQTPPLWYTKSGDDVILTLLMTGRNGLDVSHAMKSILRDTPGLVYRIATFGLERNDGWACLDTMETNELASLLGNATSTSPYELARLSEIYYWQGDYPNARELLTRANDQTRLEPEIFGLRFMPKVSILHLIEGGQMYLEQAPHEAHVVRHNVGFEALLDGKPLGGLSVGVSAAITGYESYYSGAERQARFVQTDAVGRARLENVVSGPCAAVTTLSTETMSAIPGDRAVIMNSTNLDKQTSDPATVEFGFVPPVKVMVKQSGDSDVLTWDPYPGAAKYRIASPHEIQSETTSTSFTVKREEWTDLYGWSGIVFALDGKGRMISSSLTLDFIAGLARGWSVPRRHMGLKWRRIAPGDLRDEGRR